MKTSGPTWLIWPAAPARVSSDANQMNLARGGLFIFARSTGSSQILSASMYLVKMHRYIS